MNFEEESQAILNDEDELQILSSEILKIKTWKINHQKLTQELQSMKKQIIRLQNQNYQLKKAEEQRQNERQNAIQNRVKQISVFDNVLPTLIDFKSQIQTKPSAYHVNLQQTKRKVISEFVEELAQQLQKCQQKLLRETQAHEQTKKCLQQVLKQIEDSKKNSMNIQYPYYGVLDDQKRILSELDHQRTLRIKIQKDLKDKNMFLKQYERVLIANSHQFDEQMEYIDDIFRKIEKQTHIKI